MANSLSTFNPEFWSNRVQRYIKKSGVFMAIANMEEKAKLSVGDTVNRPYTSDFQVNDYTKGTAVDIQDIDSTNEYLTVDQTKEISFYVDEIDKIQNLYDAADIRAGKAGYRLSNEMDGAFLRQVENASYDFDDGDISTATNSGAGNPIILSNSNTVNAVSLLKAKMNKESIEGDRPWDLVIDPATASFIEQQVVSSGFSTADLTLKNGYAGDFMGFKTFVSNNLLHETVITATKNLLADDAITVAGVTLTLVASPAAAGDVDLGSDLETTLENFAAAINDSGTAGTTYVALSTADRRKLTNAKVVATSTATTLTIKTSGYEAVVETTDSGTAYSVGDTVVKCLAEKRGSIDMVIQAMPTTQINKVADKTGYNFLTYDLYGIKTFQEGADRMVEFNVKAQ